MCNDSRVLFVAYLFERNVQRLRRRRSGMQCILSLLRRSLVYRRKVQHVWADNVPDGLLHRLGMLGWHRRVRLRFRRCYLQELRAVESLHRACMRRVDMWRRGPILCCVDELLQRANVQRRRLQEPVDVS
jgi:hypothetical protein